MIPPLRMAIMQDDIILFAVQKEAEALGQPLPDQLSLLPEALDSYTAIITWFITSVLEASTK